MAHRLDASSTDDDQITMYFHGDDEAAAFEAVGFVDGFYLRNVQFSL